MALKIVIAPSGFKEGLDAEAVCDCIAEGVLSACPGAEIYKIPLVDGGEGFTRALIKASGGALHPLEVTGPVGKPVKAHYGYLGGKGPKTAVIEMAAAAGLRLVPRKDRNLLTTTTYGVGQLIRAALDSGAEQILMGCGDSGTNDGGIGMAQALGVRFVNGAGKELGPGGGELSTLAHIDLSGRDRRLERVRIDAACNWKNVLCGPNGVSRIFGPQKGATPETVKRLSGAFDRYAAIIFRELKLDVGQMPGGGASGGLGAGLYAFLNAKLHPRFKIIMRYFKIDSLLQQADLVFTAEGTIDFQTPMEKIPAEIARRAKRYDLPVIVLAGAVGDGAQVNLQCGIDAFMSVLKMPCTLSQAIRSSSALITEAAEQAMRLVLVGRALKAKTAKRGCGRVV